MLDWNGTGKIDPVDIGIYAALMNDNNWGNANESDTDGVLEGEHRVPPSIEGNAATAGCRSKLMIALIVLFLCLYIFFEVRT